MKWLDKVNQLTKAQAGVSAQSLVDDNVIITLYKRQYTPDQAAGFILRSPSRTAVPKALESRPLKTLPQEVPAEYCYKLVVVTSPQLAKTMILEDFPHGLIHSTLLPELDRMGVTEFKMTFKGD